MTTTLEEVWKLMIMREAVAGPRGRRLYFMPLLFIGFIPLRLLLYTVALNSKICKESDIILLVRTANWE